MIGDRVIVACINWNQPADVPRAVSYVLRDGSAVGEVFHDDWEGAMKRANWLARQLARLEAVSS